MVSSHRGSEIVDDKENQQMINTQPVAPGRQNHLASQKSNIAGLSTIRDNRSVRSLVSGLSVSIRTGTNN